MDYGERRSVSYSREIHASKEAVWAAISLSENLNNCHPHCQQNKAVVWSKEEHEDRLEYLNGRTYVRKFLEWNEGEGYKLSIGDHEKRQSYVVWNIDVVNDSACVLSITVYPYLLANLPKAISSLPFHVWIKPRLETYLQSVTGGFEYYIQQEKRVPRNHFGKHPWFS